MSVTVEIDGKSVDVATLPETSIAALLQRGINHVLSNEVASKISAAKKQTNEDGSVKYTEADLEKLHTEAFESKVKAILEGTLGVRLAGVSRDPLASFKREYCVTALKAAYAKKHAATQDAKYKWPTGKGSGEVVAAMVGKMLANPAHAAKAEEYAKEQIAAKQQIADDMDDLIG